MIVSDKENITPKFDYKPMLVYSLIPVGLFIILSIVLLFVWGKDYFLALPNLLGILITLVIFFALVGASLTSKIRKIITRDIKKPIYITSVLFTNTLLISFFAKDIFTQQELTSYIDYWWLIVGAWVLFPIIETKKVKEYYNKNKPLNLSSWLIRGPIYAIIFYCVLMFIMIDGVALFNRVFPFIVCLITDFC